MLIAQLRSWNNSHLVPRMTFLWYIEIDLYIWWYTKSWISMVFFFSWSSTEFEHSTWNAGLDELQAGIKIARRNINNLRYADDNTLMAESKEELKSLLLRVKEESEKAGLKLNIQKKKIMASGPSHFMANRWGKSESSDRFSFLGCQNHHRQWLQPWN